MFEDFQFSSPLAFRVKRFWFPLLYTRFPDFFPISRSSWCLFLLTLKSGPLGYEAGNERPFPVLALSCVSNSSSRKRTDPLPSLPVSFFYSNGGGLKVCSRFFSGDDFLEGPLEVPSSFVPFPSGGEVLLRASLLTPPHQKRKPDDSFPLQGFPWRRRSSPAISFSVSCREKLCLCFLLE